VPLECADPRKVRNSCLVYDSGGRRVARYDKIICSGWSSGPSDSTKAGRSKRARPLRHRFALRTYRDFGVLRRALSELYRALAPMT